MTPRAAGPPARERLRLAILLLVGFCMLAFRVGARDLWDIDEGMHAVMSQEMIRTGDWAMPQFNGQAFYDKPPMLNWLVTISFVVFGEGELQARLPAVLLGLTLLMLTWLFGRRVLSSDAGFLGGIVLATSVMFVVMSRVVVHDIVLTFFDSVALFAFYLAYIDPERRRLRLVVMYLAIGGAILSKGPLGLVLPGGVVLVFLLLRRDLRFVPKMMLFRGVLLTALVAVPWYAVVTLRDPEYLRYFLMEQNFGRFVSETTRHAEPIYFYLPVILAGFFPWSCYLPLAFGRSARTDTVPDDAAPARLFLRCWVGFVFIFFTLASSKLPNYLLPMFPAAALLVGDLWQRWIAGRDSRPGRGFVVVQSVVIVCFLAIAAAIWFGAPNASNYDPEAHRLPLVGALGILVTSAILLIWCLIRQRRKAIFATAAGGMGLLVLYIAVILAPSMDDYRSSRTIALELDRRLAPNEKMMFFFDLQEAALFYTRRQARKIRDNRVLARYLQKEGNLIIIEKKTEHRLEDMRDQYQIVFEHGDKIIATGTSRK